MPLTFRRNIAKPLAIALAISLAVLLSGCGSLNRLKEIGSPPDLSSIRNPVTSPGYQPVSLPMPPVQASIHQANSLWRVGARSFFRDQRAAAVGDILTVTIAIRDKAQVDNSTTRTRGSSEDAALTNFLGLESKLAKILPNSFNPSTAVSLGSSSTTTGQGTINRKETINLVVAAVITQILPNGNLVIQGSQEVRVNFEVRELTIAGIIRPEDIAADNTIRHTQIAEARISYGGRGQLTAIQQPRYGQQLIDVVLPF